jgi:serine phosphatase RsbU (regulator of sigma subunit)
LLSSARSKHRAEELVEALTRTNDELQQQNNVLAQQQGLLQQEETLAKHVFAQLTLGGDHALPGIHTWNQSMGSLSGDLTQKARGPNGEAYVFLGDFTGHGLPAALGALPASSVFLAMAAKGLPIESIAGELNSKLRELLPVGYFCCGVLLQLSADRRTVRLWNGGLPPVLIRRCARRSHEYLRSHSLPLGVVDGDAFDASALEITLGPGDLLYAYTDGLTEAENVDGEMWGSERLETLLLRDDLPAPRLPVLIDAVLEHVHLAPASDDISVLEVEVSPAVAEQVDEADAA